MKFLLHNDKKTPNALVINIIRMLPLNHNNKKSDE